MKHKTFRRWLIVPVLAGLLIQGLNPLLLAASRPPIHPRQTPVLANGESGNLSNSSEGTYSAWADGSFNLTNDAALHFTFTPASVGTHFYVRLLPQADVDPADASLPNYLNYLTVYTVPASGAITIPLSDFLHGKLYESQLTSADLANIGQIAVFSGTNAWGFPGGSKLNPTASAQANFTQIAGLATLRTGGLTTTAPPVPASTPAATNSLSSAPGIPGTPPAAASPTPGSTSSEPATIVVPADTSNPGSLIGQQPPPDNYVPVESAAGLQRLDTRMDPQNVKNTNQLVTPQLSVHDVTSPSITPY